MIREKSTYSSSDTARKKESSQESKIPHIKNFTTTGRNLAGLPEKFGEDY